MEELKKRFEALSKEVADLRNKLEQPQAEQVAPAEEGTAPPKPAPAPPSIEQMLMDQVKGIVGERLIEIGAKTFEMSRLVEVIEPEGAEKIMKVLASADRIKIMKSLFLEGKYFSRLQELTELGPSPLNFHLTQLREAGLIEQEQLRGRYVSTLKGRVTLSLLGYLLRKVSEKEW
ncbi:MAG: winged helix-turn-helix domain-containing protein [Promethearchaeati archaeon SRVP18_Atabeyarchaeia-1]